MPVSFSLKLGRLVFLLVLAGAGSVSGQTHSTAPVDSKPPTPKKIEKAKVIFLGDSLTRNNGSLGPKRGYDHWTDVVQKRFDLSVVNLGKNGSRADAGLERLTQALVTDKQRPDFVIINFGMNDQRIVNETGQASSTVEAFEASLTKIVELTRSVGAQPILVTPHAIYEGTKGDPKGYYGRYDPAIFAKYGGAVGRLDSFIAVTRKVAAQMDVPLIDIRKASDNYKRSEYTLEGVHLNQVGHKMYADTIGDFLAAHY